MTEDKGPGREEEGMCMEGSSLGGERLVQAECFQGQKLNGERQQGGGSIDMRHRRE